MPERDKNDPASTPPNTPRVSGEVQARLELVDSTPLPESSTRAAHSPEEAAVTSEPSDTLLSAGKPADRFEVLLEDKLSLVDDRLREVDDRLRELDQRVSVLEQKKSLRVEEPRSKPWLWIVFLIALVVVFQLLRRVR
jgi:hypothetical protein